MNLHTSSRMSNHTGRALKPGNPFPAASADHPYAGALVRPFESTPEQEAMAQMEDAVQTMLAARNMMPTPEGEKARERYETAYEWLTSCAQETMRVQVYTSCYPDVPSAGGEARRAVESLRDEHPGVLLEFTFVDGRPTGAAAGAAEESLSWAERYRVTQLVREAVAERLSEIGEGPHDVSVEYVVEPGEVRITVDGKGRRYSYGQAAMP